MTKFVKDENDNYVDNGLNVVKEEGTHFNDAAIIPTVQYQVFGLDNVWFWDNEGQNYTFDKSTVSTIKLQVVTGTSKTYYKVVSGNETLSLEVTTNADDIANAIGVIPNGNTVPSGAKAGDVFYTEADILSPAEASNANPYEFNKYGKETIGNDILVTLTPNNTLKTTYPGAIITINGKEYDINHTTFKLYMDKDYRISINWAWGSVVETFRIICNR